jgi:hypothetical protein
VALVGLVARAAAGPPEDLVLFCYLTKKMSFFLVSLLSRPRARRHRPEKKKMEKTFSPNRLHDLVLPLARDVVAREHDARPAPGRVVGHLAAHEEAEVRGEAA